MGKVKLWLAKEAKEPNDAIDYEEMFRPTAGPMFADKYSTTYTSTFTDFNTNDSHNFRSTLSGSDNKLNGIQYLWNEKGGYGGTPYYEFSAGGYCKNDNYLSWHFGSIPGLHSLSEIKAAEQYVLPGYNKLQFNYRWPEADNANYWSDSPVFINKFMFHYYDPSEDQIKSNLGSLKYASPSWQNTHLYPDRWDEYSGKNNQRKSNTWRGCCFHSLSIHNGVDLFLVGASVEMKFVKYGGASRPRCMQIINMSPLWTKKSSHTARPILYRPRSNPFTATGEVRVWNQK